jgi:ribose transport system substrate-binding protein
MIGTRRITQALIGVAFCAVIAACGGSGSPSGSPSSTSSTKLSASQQAALKADIAKYEAVPSWTAPGPAINVPSLAGKKVFVIPEIPNAFNNALNTTMTQIANQAKLNWTVYANQGQVSQWAQGMSTAIAQHANLIILSAAPDPGELQPQIAAAKAAGIPVVVTHFYDESSPPPPTCNACAAGVSGLETAPFNLSAKIMAEWAVLQTGGQGGILVPVLSEVPITAGMVDSMESVFHQYCSGCDVKVLTLPITDLGTPAFQTALQGAVQAMPDLKYVVDQIDGMVPPTIAALRLAGRSQAVGITAYNGTPSFLDDITSHTFVTMDVGESAPWIAYASMDQAFRLLAGMPIVSDSNPVRVWYSGNISEAGSPASLTQGYGNSYQTGFMQLWGLP